MYIKELFGAVKTWKPQNAYEVTQYVNYSTSIKQNSAVLFQKKEWSRHMCIDMA